ncbi:hypothetical protein COCVIDRAFT_109486, partial [Bipolaris victoriae FI3]
TIVPKSGQHQDMDVVVPHTQFNPCWAKYHRFQPRQHNSSLGDISPPALILIDIFIVNNSGMSSAITERHAPTDIHLAERYFVKFLQQKQTLVHTLKKLVRGLAASKT